MMITRNYSWMGTRETDVFSWNRLSGIGGTGSVKSPTWAMEDIQ